MNHYLFSKYLLKESFGDSSTGNTDMLLKRDSISVFDHNKNEYFDINPKKIVTVVNEALYKIESKYPFFYPYIQFCKIFYVLDPNSAFCDTMATDGLGGIYINTSFVYSSMWCNMDVQRVMGILFHELMHNLLDHPRRIKKKFEVSNEILSNVTNICADFEVNGSMVADGVVDDTFWEKMHGRYNPDYEGMTWWDIYTKFGEQIKKDFLEKEMGVKMDPKTEEMLRAIDKANKVMSNKNSSQEDKDKAHQELKDKIQELFGGGDVDSPLNDLMKELNDMADSSLGEIGDIEEKMKELAKDLERDPKDMTDGDVEKLKNDMRALKKEMMDHVEEIADKFGKDPEEVVDEIKDMMKNMQNALNTASDENASKKAIKEAAKEAKSAAENLTMTPKEKKEKQEREAAEKKAKQEEAERKAKIKKEKAIKARSPFKPILDKFKNLAHLHDVDRVSQDTVDAIEDLVAVLEPLLLRPVPEIQKEELDRVSMIMDGIKNCIYDDLKKLIDEHIIKDLDEDGIDPYLDKVFGSVDDFFETVLDKSVSSTDKCQILNAASLQLKDLGKKLKTQKHIKPSEEWTRAYKEYRKRITDAWKRGGIEGARDEINDITNETYANGDRKTDIKEEE